MVVSGKGNGIGGVSDIVKEELCEKVVDIRSRVIE